MLTETRKNVALKLLLLHDVHQNIMEKNENCAKNSTKGKQETILKTIKINAHRHILWAH